MGDSGDLLNINVTALNGEVYAYQTKDVFFVNEKSYGYPERLLDEGTDGLRTTLFVNPGAVLSVEIS